MQTVDEIRVLRELLLRAADALERRWHGAGLEPLEAQLLKDINAALDRILNPTTTAE